MNSPLLTLGFCQDFPKSTLGLTWGFSIPIRSVIFWFSSIAMSILPTFIGRYRCIMDYYRSIYLEDSCFTSFQQPPKSSIDVPRPLRLSIVPTFLSEFSQIQASNLNIQAYNSNNNANTQIYIFYLSYNLHYAIYLLNLITYLRFLGDI